MNRAWLVLLFVPTAGAWDSFHGDSANTGQGPDAHAIYESIWWTVNLGSFVAADPLAVDGLVILADRDGRVTALDAGSGAQQWQHEMTAPIHGTPAAASGRLFVADSKGILQALDLQSGSVLAEAKVGPTQGDITHHQGKIFLGTEAGELTSYSRDLDLLWSFDTSTVGTTSTWNNVTDVTTCTELLPGKPIRAAPAVARGLVVFAGMDHHVYGVDEHGQPDGTTTMRWLAATQDVILAAPVLADDHAYVASYDTTVRAVPLSGGSDPCFGRIQSPTWSHEAARIHATPAWTGDSIIIARGDGIVERLHGDTSWSADVGAPVSASPVVANGTVLIADDGGTLTWLSLDNGTQLATYDAGAPIKSSPALLDDATFLVTENGQVRRLAPGILQLPDLAIQQADAGPDGLHVVIANRGPGDAPGTILSIQANGTEIDFAIVPALPAGATTNLTLDVDPGDASTLLLALDPDDTVREESEANSQTVEVQRNAAVATDGFFGLPLWIWIVAGVAALGGGGGGGFWFWWRGRE